MVVRLGSVPAGRGTRTGGAGSVTRLGLGMTRAELRWDDSESRRRLRRTKTHVVSAMALERLGRELHAQQSGVFAPVTNSGRVGMTGAK